MNIFGAHVRKCSEFPRKIWLICWRRFVLIAGFIVSLFAQCGRNFGYLATLDLDSVFWGRKWRQELDWARARPSASQRCAQFFARSPQVQVNTFFSFRVGNLFKNPNIIFNWEDLFSAWNAVTGETILFLMCPMCLYPPPPPQYALRSVAAHAIYNIICGIICRTDCIPHLIRASSQWDWKKSVLTRIRDVHGSGGWGVGVLVHLLRCHGRIRLRCRCIVRQQAWFGCLYIDLTARWEDGWWSWEFLSAAPRRTYLPGRARGWVNHPSTASIRVIRETRRSEYQTESGRIQILL